MNKRFYLVLLLTIALTPLSFLHVNAARELEWRAGNPLKYPLE